MPETTYLGFVGDLEKLITALIANAAELPQLEGLRGQLEQNLNLTRATAQEQAALTARKQDASQRIGRLMRDGQRLVTAARKILKAHYGLNAEKLAEFGIPPFRGRKRRPEPEAPAPEPTPPDEAKSGS
jgi:hypothetical protein